MTDDLNQLLILLLLALPVLGAIVCALLPDARRAKGLALLISLAGLVVALLMLFRFQWDNTGAGPDGMQFGFYLGSITAINFSGGIGVDSISLWLIVLTALLMPLAIASSFESIQDRAKQYYAWMLALQAAMLGVFVARDALLFYIFFELTLVPMFFIIGIWGGPQRRHAAGKFFLFTFTGSVFTLAAVIYLGLHAKSFDITFILQHALFLSSTERFWVVLGLLAGFAVKVPLFPVHTWLPLAHTEAPTAGSVILAGVLLKLGTYGILRLVLPIGFLVKGDVSVVPFPELIHFVGWLCIIGIIYGALVAWVQQDIKKLVAYSSVSHLGFCVLGLAALNHEGIQGSILYMINHGLSTGALFLVIGMIYERYHTRDINELSGLAKKMPIMAFFFILFTLSSIGLPGLNGFASEFLTILGAFKSPHLGIAFGSLAALGVILGAVYMLHMAARVIWGPLKTPGGHDTHGGEESSLPADLSAREIGILIPLALAVVVLGVIPGKMLNTFLIPVNQLIGEPATVATTERSIMPPIAAKLP
jgi:NADH-quinone oxidoreductase subunit M